MRTLTKTRLLLASVALAGAAWAGTAAAEEVTIALRVQVNTFDPHKTATVGSDLSVLSHIYPALLLRGTDLKLQPSVATSWEAVDDNTWRFTLREGATFANGEPINAETVKWNIERVLDPEQKARIAGWFKPIDKVEAVSDSVVEIHTSTPFPALPDQLSMFLMLPPQWASEHDPATETMSGGMYAVSENVPGDHVTLSANPDYWGDAPAFDTVTFRTIPEESSRIAALLAGEVDLITGIPATEIERVDAADNASAGAVPATRSIFIKFNTFLPPLDNKTYRQALNYAVDKDAIAEVIFGGRAEVSSCQVMTPDYFGYNPDLEPYPYDPDKARELLAQSGVDLSQPLQFDIPSNQYLQGTEVSEVVASQLAEVGVTVNLTEIEFGAYLDKYVRSDKLEQTSLLGQAWPTIDADGMLGLFKGGTIYAYWDNPDFVAALDKGGSTTDAAARLAAYKQATEIMCDEAPVIFLYAQPATYGLSDRVTWTPRGDDWVRAFDMAPAS
jgi:peptide/nickel transport system substrate-binding protein